MTSPKRPWVGRLLRTVPERDKADKRAGATFVNILFGLVVTQIAIELSKELVNWWGVGWVEVSETRLAHLLVALTLTALSWIGYHQSQQYPPFLIKFVNIPLLQFFLDVSMVVVYYVVVAVAENSDPLAGPVLVPSARPEALLVFVTFGLYAVWDISGRFLFADPEYTSRLETPRDPQPAFGPRRRVTFWFTGVTGLIALAIWLTHPTAPGPVIFWDATLIAVLILYRLFKQGVDPKVKVRPPETQPAALASDQP
jgi:hypothetical protein